MNYSEMLFDEHMRVIDLRFPKDYKFTIEEFRDTLKEAVQNLNERGFPPPENLPPITRGKS